MNIKRLEDKCNKCMLCVRDCVSGVWRIVDGVPAPVQPDLCNLCSHCIAVCPRDAILHEGLNAAQTTKVNRKNLLPNVYRDIVMSRRSVRQFREREVPREVIEQVLSLARYAPTASNEQNVGYIVITDKKLIEKSAKAIFGFASRLYDRTKKGIVKLIVRSTGLAENRYIKAMDYAQKQTKEAGRDQKTARPARRSERQEGPRLPRDGLSVVSARENGFEEKTGCEVDLKQSVRREEQVSADHVLKLFQDPLFVDVRADNPDLVDHIVADPVKQHRRCFKINNADKILVFMH
jgi:NAD-dependent dihydropyrimidine dehydrogenase PreA subunit